MAEWPNVEEAINLLDIGDQDWITDHLDRALTAAIERVKSDVGAWDDYVDEPDEQLVQAALRLVVVQRVNPSDDLTHAVGSDHIYLSLLAGHRRRFAIS